MSLCKDKCERDGLRNDLLDRANAVETLKKGIVSLSKQRDALKNELEVERGKALQWGEHAKESQKAAREIEAKLTESEKSREAVA